MRYRGALFRALNPIYAREPYSGRGAELYGGRFNPRGVPALYSSLTVITALREANQAGSFQPITLVSYDAEINGVFDSRDEAALRAAGCDTETLADSGWRDQMEEHGEARTQSLARVLMAKGYRAMLVRSFAPGSTANDLNLVLWEWGASAPARLTLVDDEKRLSG
ncbi:MAG: RES domain-containing protein [Hyphomicrobiales bacterium]|nr:RES domain-containing protein [Hyphomicrobiales bacterium]MBV9054726.1 RES domain-containing protein [Hyphomicrobiales bacterium]MBV9138028.1 RES domain-containing protein [Hyphomicrobiales bacterium]MBV9591897.1 RES domain-containing protein [Hyphomicrobiales bacterium]MBV9976928.1 RES domain-containing protein [Hyphomicrobiales bacterium]